MPRLKQGCIPDRCLPALCILGFALLASAGGCQREGREARLRVVTSTTMLEAVVREIGGERVEAAALVPAGMLPEDFAPAPENLKLAARADLVIMSGWEDWLSRITEAVGQPRNIALTGIAADLMLPYYHLDAADSVTEALVRRDPDGEVFYRYNRADYRSRLAAEAEDICASMMGASEVRVICSETQADFLDYMGFDIVGTYGAAADPAAGEIARLIEVGRTNGVRLVVDDFHMRTDAGERIAVEIGAARVVLRRYPPGITYLDLLRNNAEKLLSTGVRSQDAQGPATQRPPSH